MFYKVMRVVFPWLNYATCERALWLPGEARGPQIERRGRDLFLAVGNRVVVISIER
ncbi:MAG TPA: hypothetical protein VF161_00900 [Steroidobacteraceae bacterium]